MLKLYHERQQESSVTEAMESGVFACASISVIEETYENSIDGPIDKQDLNLLLLPH